MNDQSVSADVKALFDAMVKNYTPKVSGKFRKLYQLQEGITELRSKGASCQVIASILREAHIIVSPDTIVRFCREVLEPTGFSRRKKKISPPAGKLPKTPQRPRATELKSAQGVTPNSTQKTPHRAEQASGTEVARTKGPRIADPNNI